MRHRIIIDQRRPWLRWLLLGVASCALVVAAAWALSHYVRTTTADEYEHTQSEVEALQSDRRTLLRDLNAARKEVRALKDSLAYAKQSQVIDAEAAQQVKASLKQLQAEASDLREQLAFYRSIAAPEQSRAGVRVHELKLAQDETTQAIRYDLVLIQSASHDQRVAGQVEMTLVGTRNGQDVTIPWTQLRDGSAQKDVLFSLRYFQEFSGQLRLPDDVTPLRVVVTLTPKAAGAPKVEEAFDWARLVNG